jgi:DNA-binding transcriptional regulator YiaG
MSGGRPRSFKRLLREAREALGISKAEAARRLGIPYRTFQNWELGLRTPQAAFTKAAVLEGLWRMVESLRR